MNGGLVIEVLGADGAVKADRLAEELKNVISGEVYINRPIRKSEICITGIDDSVTPDEIIDVIVKRGDCDREHVKIGDIRPMANGLGTVGRNALVLPLMCWPRRAKLVSAGLWPESGYSNHGRFNVIDIGHLGISAEPAEPRKIGAVVVSAAEDRAMRRAPAHWTPCVLFAAIMDYRRIIGWELPAVQPTTWSSNCPPIMQEQLVSGWP